MNAGVPQAFNAQWFRKEKTPKGFIAFGRSYFLMELNLLERLTGFTKYF